MKKKEKLLPPLLNIIYNTGNECQQVLLRLPGDYQQISSKNM
jgi:hypothetical protein